MRTENGKGAVHNRLRVYRTDRGWSRQDLAERVGVNFQTIGYIERGDYAPSLELALRLAAAFRVRVEDVFSLFPFTPLGEQVQGNGTNEGAER